MLQYCIYWMCNQVIYCSTALAKAIHDFVISNRAFDSTNMNRFRELEQSSCHVGPQKRHNKSVRTTPQTAPRHCKTKTQCKISHDRVTHQCIGLSDDIPNMCLTQQQQFVYGAFFTICEANKTVIV